MADIITGSEIQAQLGSPLPSLTARFDQIAAGVNEFIGGYTGRDWAQVARTNEKHVGCDTDTIVLEHYPVASLTALTVDGATWDVADDKKVVVDKRRGLLYRTDGENWPETRHRPVIVVSYVGGPIAPPADLKLAALELGGWLYKQTGGRAQMTDKDLTELLHAKAMDELPGAGLTLERYRDPARGYLE